MHFSQRHGAAAERCTIANWRGRSPSWFNPMWQRGGMMTWMLTTIAIGTFLSAPRMVSTQARAVTVADSATVAHNVYTRLFDGIELSAEQRRRAMKIILKQVVEQASLQGDAREVWPRVVALMAKRDSSLSALLTSPADKAKFEKHALSSRPAPPPH